MISSVIDAVSKFGAEAKQKLSNPGVSGEPEDQLRAPFEMLLSDLADAVGFQRNALTAVGESSVSDLKTRPDYAITINKLLVGFIELKAPGKGADPRKFKNHHDKSQWSKLRSLPNLIYSDGNEFSLWQEGELVGGIVRLQGDIETSGNKLEPHPDLLPLFERFLQWEPIPPKNVAELARISARLCRLLRDEVTEQLGLGSEALSSLATDWRMLLFPEATDKVFADGYAQAVTFGLLMARARNISLSEGFSAVGQELAETSSLIGTALRFLTDNAESRKTLKTSLDTLKRVLDHVSWDAISKGDSEAWLYFYEDFLKVYDNDLRKQTGSYYTPPEVVQSMVRLVDEVLTSSRFNQHRGLASPAVTIADPATGTGTFLLGILRKIAEKIEEDEGKGAVGAAISEAISRLIAFEMQLGPFAVAQLRIIAEILELTGAVPTTPPRMYVTNTLGDPNDDEGWIPGILAPIAKSREEANKIKRDEKITVVIGNPPYREKAKGLGGWVEGKTKLDEKTAILADWQPPKDWGVGLHSKHLRNLYVYFWRWATWKVFDQDESNSSGIVCFITVAGFLSGPGFEKMRAYLRSTCQNIWVIDCSPEGYQPPVNTRIFQGVQQPVCIVLASRSNQIVEGEKFSVYYRSLPKGNRKDKFKIISKISLEDAGWIECPKEARAPFLPASQGAWSRYPKLESFFLYNGSGVMPGRTWVIAPDAYSLEKRWSMLVSAPKEEKETLFHPHIVKGKLGDKHVHREVASHIPGFKHNTNAISLEKATNVTTIRYAFRSFDRQRIIPDNRVINRPNPNLWKCISNDQIFITALLQESPTKGPALTVTNLIPDLDHYKGSFGGRVFPLWKDSESSCPNVKKSILSFLEEIYDENVSAEDVMSYIVCISAHNAYTNKFKDDFSTPGIRIPLTGDCKLFKAAVDLGKRVIWLHTFGERMVDSEQNRPAGPPRLPKEKRPYIPSEGKIPSTSEGMPDAINYNIDKKRLEIGSGFIDNVNPSVWSYEISGKQVLTQWFSYRKANRDRPIIGNRRKPSPLCVVQPDHWLAEYTSELINVLNVLGMLVELEPEQKAILDQICSGSLIDEDQLMLGGSLEEKPIKRKKGARTDPTLFDAVKK